MGTLGLAGGVEPIILPSTIPFQDFFRAQSPVVFRAALRVLNNAADAEDVMQTVFLRLYKQSPPPDLAALPPAYMRRAAVCAAIDILRQRATRGELPLDPSASHPGMGNSALLKETLRRALSRLSAQDAELFLLRNVEGFSYEELAELFAIERGTVASRLHRIRQTLLEALK